MQSILDLGIRLIVALQGLGTWPTLPMRFFSFLGTKDFFMLALPMLYWYVDSMLGIRVALILMLSTNINSAFKLAFHGPRPYWYSPKVRALATETSFGVPSGHAQGAVVFWGLLATYLRKWWSWLVAILFILLIGLSRLYLGVHFPHDVLLGWLIGGVILWLGLRFWDPVLAWAKKTRRRLAGSLRLFGLAGVDPFSGYSLYLVKSRKLATCPGLGHIRITGHYIVRCSNHRRYILRDACWPNLAGRSGWLPDQRVGVETCLALSAGSGRCFYYQIRTEIYLPQWRERTGLLLRLSALYGDWFLGDRRRAMDIYPRETGCKAEQGSHYSLLTLDGANFHI